MTVGITLNNGLEAIAITDSQVSGGWRESNSDDKLSSFSGENYDMVLFGTGSASDIDSIAKRLEQFKEADLENYVSRLHQEYHSRLKKYGERVLSHEKQKIELKAACISGEKEKTEFLKRNLERLFDGFEEKLRESNSQLVVVGFDKTTKNIRSFQFSLSNYHELFLNHLEIGSGSDGANLYFGSKLQGIETNKLSPEQLAFFSLNAYGTSTLNRGVGGLPKIARISKDGVEVYDAEKTRAMANLSGAYLAEFNSALTAEKVVERLGDIMENSRPNYRSVAKGLGLNVDAVTGLYIPYSSWQERANIKNFGKK